ncbi:hypothetical+protein [Methylocapsa aurea]|jgi:hypothetical protein
MGAPSLPPGRYFRMHMVGYFEGLDSERGIAWRCADSFSLRDLLRLSTREKILDHSWLSKTRTRLPHAFREQAFGFVLQLVAERGLVKGERIGVDGSTMEVNTHAESDDLAIETAAFEKIVEIVLATERYSSYRMNMPVSRRLRRSPCSHARRVPGQNLRHDPLGELVDRVALEQARRIDEAALDLAFVQ